MIAEKRTKELEKLICKIYDDNALGKLPDSRYAALDTQYAARRGCSPHPPGTREFTQKEEPTDRLHQSYLHRKANGKQREYEERTKLVKRIKMEEKKPTSQPRTWQSV